MLHGGGDSDHYRGPQLFTPKILHFLVQLSFILLLLQHRTPLPVRKKKSSKTTCSTLHFTEFTLFATSVHKAEQINELKKKNKQKKMADESSFLSVQQPPVHDERQTCWVIFIDSPLPSCLQSHNRAIRVVGGTCADTQKAVLRGVTEDCREARGAAPWESIRHEARGAAVGELLHPLGDRQEVRLKLHLVAFSKHFSVQQLFAL